MKFLQISMQNTKEIQRTTSCQYDQTGNKLKESLNFSTIEPPNAYGISSNVNHKDHMKLQVKIAGPYAHMHENKIQCTRTGSCFRS